MLRPSTSGTRSFTFHGALSPTATGVSLSLRIAGEDACHDWKALGTVTVGRVILGRSMFGIGGRMEESLDFEDDDESLEVNDGMDILFSPALRRASLVARVLNMVYFVGLSVGLRDNVGVFRR